MSDIYLNIGCGRELLQGFVNIDLEPHADLQLDVTQGLPYTDGEVHGIYSEHFIEHLSLADGARFFRECRRVLAPGAIMRVATPDLDAIVTRYATQEWLGSGMKKHGFHWVNNRAEMMNLVMREWGHQWLYNEEELVRVAELSGLRLLGRREPNQSANEHLSGLETRPESTLIMEFVKSGHRLAMASGPLVSILIPAYNPRYFRQALESALAQTYKNVEIVISDDSPGDDIARITEQLAGANPAIRYYRNETPYGARFNYLRCHELARGEFIKFLNDDDLIDAMCVESMLVAFAEHPGVTLVTSYRRFIDADGRDIENSGNAPLSQSTVRMNGVDAAAMLVLNRTNYIGEPTTAMFRKADIDGLKPDFLSLGGEEIRGNGDVALWMNLLSKGDLCYIAEPLSCFRIHEEQRQRNPEVHQMALRSWNRLFYQATRLGLIRTESTSPVGSQLTVEQPSPRLRVVVFSLDHPLAACANLRISQYGEYFPKDVEIIWAVENASSESDIVINHDAIELADIIIIQRLFPHPITSRALKKIFESGKPVIYESDDLLVERMPDSNPLAAEASAYIESIRDVATHASIVTVSTEKLKQEFLKYNSNVFVIPNLLNPMVWQAKLPVLPRDKVVIGYAGTITHSADVAMVEEAILKICEKYGDKIELLFMGYASERLKTALNYRCLDFELDYKSYAAKLNEQDIDIALAPLVQDRFNEAKSNIKWLEYSMCGFAGVYSDLAPYNTVVRNGENGMLAGGSVDAWYEAIDTLIANPQLRRAIASTAQQEVVAHHTLKSAGNNVVEVWREVSKLTRSANGSVLEESHRIPSYLLDEAYQQWLKKHALSEGGAQLMAERMVGHWVSHPGIHLLTYVDESEFARLADSLDSLNVQFYKGWALTVISSAPCPDQLFHDAPHLEWLHIEGDAHTAAYQACEAGGADWIVAFQPGDCFEPKFTFTLAEYANLHPEWGLIYYDEDVIDSEGQRALPSFKPDFNNDLLRSEPYIGYGYAIKRESLQQQGTFSGFSKLGAYYSVLRYVELQGVSGIGHIADVLFSRSLANESGEQVADYEAQFREVLQEHLRRLNVDASVGEGLAAGTWRCAYHHDIYPKVSIIIPNKNSISLLMECVESLMEKTTYPDFEVLIVDNGSDVDDVLEYYQRLQQRYSDQVRVLEYNQPFNYSAMNNLAAGQARGEYLLLLNNDTQIIQEEWLERMVMHGMRDEVGIVGCRLVFPGTTLVQHAGVVIGMGGPAAHPFIGHDLKESGYLNRLQVDQNYSAVTAACLLVRRALFDAVGGLDEERFKVLYNDVDLCLKVRQQGYLVVWTPYATVVHHGSKTLKDKQPTEEELARTASERDAMYQKWRQVIGSDPAYNPNLSLAAADCSVESQVVANWDRNIQDKPRILGFPLDELGCGYYRVYSPLWGLEHASMAYTTFVPSHDRHTNPRVPLVSELERLGVDSLLLQSTLKDNQLEQMVEYKRSTNIFKVFDLDDLKTDVPESNVRAKYLFKDMKHRLRRALSMCDRLMVSTEPLAEAYGDMCDDVVVVPNYLSEERWGLHHSKRRAGRKPRVGWAGAQQHHGDLAIIAPVVEALADEVEWVFFGMCIDELRPYVSEVHDFVSLNEYPAKLASLDLDLALAPLELNRFNEAKTNLRVLEYGIMGWPVICSDIYPYQGAPVTCLPNTPELWLEAVRERINDLDATEKEGDRLREWVQRNWMLEDNLDVVLRALLPK